METIIIVIIIIDYYYYYSLIVLINFTNLHAFLCPGFLTCKF